MKSPRTVKIATIKINPIIPIALTTNRILGIVANTEIKISPSLSSVPIIIAKARYLPLISERGFKLSIHEPKEIISANKPISTAKGVPTYKIT